MMLQARQISMILSDDDPDPVDIVNRAGVSEFVLTCEHAGRAIAGCLGDLGVSAQDMDRHIAWDIGAEGLSRALASLLDAPLVLQRYSRLIVDCNRPFEAADCFPEVSDGTAIPANRSLSTADRMQRFSEIHEPLHRTIEELLDGRERAGRRTVLISVHSFTPILGGFHRPWLLGALANRDASFARAFLHAFSARNADISVALNEPYTVDDMSDYTIPVHGERRRLAHVLLEVRNDQIGDSTGQARWARLLADALRDASASLKEVTNVD
jgi:predicted N-formylglutamate amidohydrolase